MHFWALATSELLSKFKGKERLSKPERREAVCRDVSKATVTSGKGHGPLETLKEGTASPLPTGQKGGARERLPGRQEGKEGKRRSGRAHRSHMARAVSVGGTEAQALPLPRDAT